MESAARKCAVIDRLIRAAGIANARSVRARAEEWGALPAPAGGGAGGYDAVTAARWDRSRCSLEYAAPLLREGGVLVAWKGARDPDEEARGRRGGGGARDAVGGGARGRPVRGRPPPPPARVPQGRAPRPPDFPRRARDGPQAAAGLIGPEPSSRG